MKECSGFLANVYLNNSLTDLIEQIYVDSHQTVELSNLTVGDFILISSAFGGASLYAYYVYGGMGGFPSMYEMCGNNSYAKILCDKSTSYKPQITAQDVYPVNIVVIKQK